LTDAKYRCKQGLKCFELVHFEVIFDDLIAFLVQTLMWFGRSWFEDGK